MTDNGILNMDVRTRNFRQSRFEVFMIDSVLCHFRRESTDDNDWWRWKGTQDEEGDLAWALGEGVKGRIRFSTICSARRQSYKITFSMIFGFSLA